MTTFARDPSCDACRRITSGDCGRHGPLRRASPERVDGGLRERVLRILNDSGSYESMEAVADAILAAHPATGEPPCIHGSECVECQMDRQDPATGEPPPLDVLSDEEAVGYLAMAMGRLANEAVTVHAGLRSFGVVLTRKPKDPS